MARSLKKKTTHQKGQPAKTVAIACQGGGSHTAFTAGVLSELLTHERHGKDFRLLALSGTSGGAVCAGLAWSHLLHPLHEPPPSPAELRQMGRAAADALQAFWLDLACEPAALTLDNPLLFPWQFPRWQRGPFDYLDSAANALWQAAARLNPFGEAECKLASRLTRARMEELFARHAPLQLLEGKNLKLQWPRLRLGATNICEGWTRPLRMEDYSAKTFHALMLASAAIPPLFQPVRVNGDYYWDGLYSHNPPVECLANPSDEPQTGCPDPKEVPDEIWVVQINPEKSPHPPRNVAELLDRRNELSGNLSLAAELYHIDAMNGLLEKHYLPEYKAITLRLVRLDQDLSLASKYDRSRDHIERLFRRGQEKAPEFFKDSSRWTSKPEGVAQARLSRKRAVRFPDMAALASTAACTTLCPANALCKTFPQIGPCQEFLLDVGQRCFEGRVLPAAAKAG